MFAWLSAHKAAMLVPALVLLLLPAAMAGAQEPGEENVIEAPAESSGRTISLDVQEADIATVLRSLATYSGMNIVASPRVEGKVTVKLTDVPWREALTVILRAHGYDYVEEHGILMVDTAEELRRDEIEAKRAEKQVEDLEPLVLGFVHFSFAKAEEVKEALVQMCTQRGQLDVDVRTNTLLINDIPARVELVRQLAQELDTHTPQVEINAKLVDIDRRASRDLGITWAAENIKDADVNLVGGVSVDAPVQSPAGQLRVGTVQSYGDLLVNIQALEKANLAHIISNPVITTADNREASILVGQKIPLIVADEAGNAVVQLTTIGIMLKVTPHVNNPDQITLDVHNEVSDLSSQATVQGGVIINTSESDTRVLVSNGETAIIGGLLRSVESDLTTGVPVLKDIPLLGGLFRSESKVRNNRELVVFVTPQIITDEYLTRDKLSYESPSASGTSGTSMTSTDF
jgi:type IV pilus assembly protein PilQ